MAFTVPDFNLTCDIYNGPWLSKSLRLSSPCNLAFGRRVNALFQDFDVPEVAAASIIMGLLLPAGTDVRDGFQGFPPDVVEVPAGSGRWYQGQGIDDVGKGFANEYRFMFVCKIGNIVDPALYTGLFWPTPIP